LGSVVRFVPSHSIMSALEEPKKPASGYFIYVNATREKVQVELGQKSFGAVTKLQADRWKSMPANEKATYEKEAAERKSKYEKDVAAFKEKGGVMGAARKEKKDLKSAKADKKAKKEANTASGCPKRPAGGGYGCYMSKNRAEISKSLPAGSKITDVSKAAGDKWKALSDAAKKPYEDEYKKLKEKYDVDFKAWKESQADGDAEEGDEGDEGEDDEDKKGAAKKRASAAESPPAKKAKAKAKPRGAKESPGPVIDPKLMEQATALKFDGGLKNLAAREELSSISHDKMLAALKQAGGLVNKAKAALLGA